MLYEIREAHGKSKVYFSKKKGLKFKKSFSQRESAEYFAEEYLCYCCLACRQNGWVYKTQMPEPFRSSVRGGARDFPPVGTVTTCPECRSKHSVQHEDVRIHYSGPYANFLKRRIVLVLSSE